MILASETGVGGPSKSINFRLEYSVSTNITYTLTAEMVKRMKVVEYESHLTHTGLYSKPRVPIPILHSDITTNIQSGTILLATRILVGSSKSIVIGCQLLLGLLKNGKT